MTAIPVVQLNIEPWSAPQQPDLFDPWPGGSGPAPPSYPAPYLIGLAPDGIGPPGPPLRPQDFVMFSVYAYVPFTRIVVSISYPGFDIDEFVFSGSAGGGAFSDAYNDSTCVATTDSGHAGFTFTIRRKPLWPDSPHLNVIAVDSAGKEL